MAPAAVAGWSESQGFRQPAILASCSVSLVGGAGAIHGPAAVAGCVTGSHRLGVLMVRLSTHQRKSPCLEARSAS